MLDFKKSMTGLMRQIAVRVEALNHVDMSRVLVSASFSRSGSNSGLLAYVLPLKYKEATPVERRLKGSKSEQYSMMPVFHRGSEILYIMYFMLPRFYNLSLQDKLETIVHEMYHVHPACNGDLRRFKGRSTVHGKSMEHYDSIIRVLTQEFLSTNPPAPLYAFLKSNFRGTEQTFGKVIANHIPEPKPKFS